MSTARPLGSILFPGLPRYYGPLRLPSATGFPVIYSRSPSGSCAESRWVSQVPRCVFPRAPSPTTPGCSASAYTRCFLADIRLRHLRQLGRTRLCNEAESGSLALGLTRSRSAGFSCFAFRLPPDHRSASHAWLPSHRGPPLHGERAITMADTLQSARRTRLGLARRRSRRISGMKALIFMCFACLGVGPFC